MSGAPVRVMVLDAWDEVTLPAAPEMTVTELKRIALRETRVADDPAKYLVKFRGAELRDEEATLAANGVPAGGAVIVMRRRRRAVR